MNNPEGEISKGLSESKYEEKNKNNSTDGIFRRVQSS